jgi:type III restriction enzyme
VREHVGAWRSARYPGITAVTRDLFAYWQAPDREKPLFFCQIEALETAIFLAEVGGNRQPWIENKLREDGQARNSGLARIAFKMATGSDKTVVMAMLIACQALNKRSDPHAERFANGRSGSASRRAAVPRDQVRPTDKLTA